MTLPSQWRWHFFTYEDLMILSPVLKAIWQPVVRISDQYAYPCICQHVITKPPPPWNQVMCRDFLIIICFACLLFLTQKFKFRMFLRVFFSTSLLCLVSIRFHFLTSWDVNYYNCKWMETTDMLTKIFLSSTFLSRIIVPWSFLLKTFSKTNSTYYEIWYAIIAPSIFLFINLLIRNPYFVLVKQLYISLRIFAKNLKAFSFANIL